MARTGADALKPSCVRKVRIVAHTGQNGRNDGQQIMVDRGHAFIGHVCSRGFSRRRRARSDKAENWKEQGCTPSGTREGTRYEKILSY
jgi:hypothetical protein